MVQPLCHHRSEPSLCVLYCGWAALANPHSRPRPIREGPEPRRRFSGSHRVLAPPHLRHGSGLQDGLRLLNGWNKSYPKALLDVIYPATILYVWMTNRESVNFTSSTQPQHDKPSRIIPLSTLVSRRSLHIHESRSGCFPTRYRPKSMNCIARHATTRDASSSIRPTFKMSRQAPRYTLARSQCAHALELCHPSTTLIDLGMMLALVPRYEFLS